MLELFVLASLVLGGLLALGVAGALAGFVFWAIVLPFRIVGWVLHGVFGLVLGAVLLPVLLVAGAIALGAGVLALALPLAPAAIFVLVLWWIFKRNRRTPTAAS